MDSAKGGNYASVLCAMFLAVTSLAMMPIASADEQCRDSSLASYLHLWQNPTEVQNVQL